MMNWSKTTKKLRAFLLFLSGLLLAGSWAIRGMMNGYNPVLKVSSQRYDAQIVKHTKSGDPYPIYKSGPYNTSSSTQTGISNGKRYVGDYVRVMQTKITKTGIYAKLRYFNRYIGWMNISGLKPVTVSQIASQMMKQYDVSGSALIASAGSRNIAVVSNGFANAAKKIANSSGGAVLYPLASLQKVMTGAIIQQLIENGDLSATTSLNRYYPQIKGSQNITIGQLLSMTSGIDNEDITPDRAMTEKQAYADIVKRLNSTGKQGYLYSDANYVLLAGIIAKVTGQSYTKNLQDRIINRLGMNSTEIVNAQKVDANSIAISYFRDGLKDYTNPQSVSLPRLSSIPGAGNLLTTPSDYYKLILGLQDGTILTAQQYQELLSYGSVYSGGMYVSKKGVAYSNGSFDGQGFHSGYLATTDNYHLAIVFENQPPLNLGAKKFVEKMYEIATYY
ncbi:serine hydrolase [Lentilactobacillus raoultii]|uniref:Serine hydrolase n=1 Tax=Lentilactobacillus raoultii TaxID=1987503 RepID=A0ABW3PNI9_9LACO|nr:class A beta-lactamase-related serine hydrolase [Lentilactobacillus raoultii]